LLGKITIGVFLHLREHDWLMQSHHKFGTQVFHRKTYFLWNSVPTQISIIL